MTKKECMIKVKEMTKDVVDLIYKKASSLLDSGAINLEDFENDYVLPKILISAIGKEISDQYCPPSSKYKKIVNNLKYF